MNAGEQVTEKVIKNFLGTLSSYGIANRNIQPAFGMAEVATCMTYNNDFNFNKSVVSATADNNFGFIDLGFPTAGTAIRITNNDDKALNEKDIGNLQIKGSSTFPGYYNSREENVFDQDGWFNTGDLGFIYKGNLFITGRAKEVIIVHGVNYYCHEIENILNGLQGIKPTFVAACAVKKQNSDNEQKEMLVVFFVSDKKNVLEETIVSIKKTMVKSIGVAPEYVLPLAEEEFPKTTSGKIQRLKLKKLFQQGYFDNFSKEMFDWFLS